MACLEDLTIGTSLISLSSKGAATVIGVKRYGNSVLDATHKDNRGPLANQLLYREDEPVTKFPTTVCLPSTLEEDSQLKLYYDNAFNRARSQPKQNRLL